MLVGYSFTDVERDKKLSCPKQIVQELAACMMNTADELAKRISKGVQHCYISIIAPNTFRQGPPRQWRFWGFHLLGGH